jgi:cytidine deaminase
MVDNSEVTKEQVEQLKDRVVAALELSYSPYSKFRYVISASLTMPSMGTN